MQEDAGPTGLSLGARVGLLETAIAPQTHFSCTGASVEASAAAAVKNVSLPCSNL